MLFYMIHIFKSNVAYIFQVNVIRKQHPYGNCTTNYQNDKSDMYVGLHDVQYSEMVSILFCIHTFPIRLIYIN